MLRQLPFPIVASLLVVSAPSAFASDLTASCVSAAKATSLAPVAVLDFDGDGFSDIVTSRTVANETEFSVLRSSDASEVVERLPAGVAAPGDYDGDGKWDFATVRDSGKTSTWFIKPSASGIVVTRQFGGPKARPLVGCKLVSSTANSLAAVDSGRVTAIELNSSLEYKGSFSKLEGGKLIGCGEITNDGKDELLLQAPSPARKLDELATLGCSNEVLVYRNLKPFTSVGVVNRNGLDFPFVLALRGPSAKKKSLDLEAVAETVEYPDFPVDKNSTFSSGYFRTAAGGSYGVLVQAPGSSLIAQRLVDAAPAVETVVATAREGMVLVPPQRVVRAD